MATIESSHQVIIVLAVTGDDAEQIEWTTDSWLLPRMVTWDVGDVAVDVTGSPAHRPNMHVKREVFLDDLPKVYRDALTAEQKRIADA